MAVAIMASPCVASCRRTVLVGNSGDQTMARATMRVMPSSEPSARNPDYLSRGLAMSAPVDSPCTGSQRAVKWLPRLSALASEILSRPARCQTRSAYQQRVEKRRSFSMQEDMRGAEGESATASKTNKRRPEWLQLLRIREVPAEPQARPRTSRRDARSQQHRRISIPSPRAVETR